jgi:hypothetical protein
VTPGTGVPATGTPTIDFLNSPVMFDNRDGTVTAP